MEIRSYRGVFELERRIYRIDRVRLNPAGVPVRGIVYFLGLLLAAFVLGAAPLIGLVFSQIPWYVRDVAAPGACAALLTVIRIDGRPSHLAFRALLRHVLEVPCSSGMRPSGRRDRRWLPPDLTIVPDGSGALGHRFSYRGPGSVRVRSPHEFVRARRWATAVGSDRRRLALRALAPSAAEGPERLIVLERGARLEVRPARRATRLSTRA